MNNEKVNSAQYVKELHDKYGPFIGGSELRKLLGFQTYHSFRQADQRGLLPVKVFTMQHRQGKFALTQDVAQWLYRTIQQINEGN